MEHLKHRGLSHSESFNNPGPGRRFGRPRFGTRFALDRGTRVKRKARAEYHGLLIIALFAL